MDVGLFFYLFDLAGTFVFAMTGALAGVKKRLDIYGLFILAILTSLGGGMIRDVFLGRTPPAAFTEVAYFCMAVCGALVVIFFYRFMGRFSQFLRLADAVGLGIFTVIGTRVCLETGGSWFAAVMMGVVTGTGGGMLRDVLVGEVPFVLQKEIYAVASLAGGIFYVVWVLVLQLPQGLGALLGAAITTTLRVVALLNDWALPRIGSQ